MDTMSRRPFATFIENGHKQQEYYPHIQRCSCSRGSKPVCIRVDVILLIDRGFSYLQECMVFQESAAILFLISHLLTDIVVHLLKI